MDIFEHIKSRQDILLHMKQLKTERLQIESELADELRQNECRQTAMIDNLIRNEISNQIPLISNDTKCLANLYEFTLKTGRNVNEKIRQYEQIKTNVVNCIKQIDDIIDLRSCTDGIEQSLRDENFEQAARHIYRFLSIDEQMLRNSIDYDFVDDNFAGDHHCSLEQSLLKLNEAKRNLQKILAEKFQQAISRNDSTNVERFFKIFPLIQQSQQGLQYFGDYLASQIRSEFVESKLTSTTKSSLTLVKLTKLFEIVAGKIDANYPLIETYYGPGNLFPIIKKLQLECDSHLAGILNDYQNDRTFSKLISNVTNLLKNFSNQSKQQSIPSAPVIDSKLIDKHLNDIMLMINRKQTYLNFVTKRLMDDLAAAAGDAEEVPSSPRGPRSLDGPHRPKAQSELEKTRTIRKEFDTFIRDCKLTQLIHDLDSIYVLFEEYFLKESIQKAIELNQIDSIDTIDYQSSINPSAATPTPVTSSMLDDIFFIVKKCIKRSISCGSSNVLMAILNHCCTVLELIFFNHLEEQLRNCPYPASAAANLSASALPASASTSDLLQTGRTYLQSSSLSLLSSMNDNLMINNLNDQRDQEQMKLMYLCLINNLQLSCDYIDSLQQSIRNDVHEMNILTTNQLELFDSCLSNFESIRLRFQLLQQNSLRKQLYQPLFKPLLRQMIDQFQMTQHQLSDDNIIEFESSNDGLRGYVRTYLLSINQSIPQLRWRLTEKNFQTLLVNICQELSNNFYKSMFKCQFNKLGAFQLDRELRAIINFLQSLTNVQLREYFLKLKFILTMFTMDNIDEINNYIRMELNDNSMTNSKLHISNDELQKLLLQYIDLNPNDVRKLKF